MVANGAQERLVNATGIVSFADMVLELAIGREHTEAVRAMSLSSSLFGGERRRRLVLSTATFGLCGLDGCHLHDGGVNRSGLGNLSLGLVPLQLDGRGLGLGLTIMRGDGGGSGSSHGDERLKN